MARGSFPRDPAEGGVRHAGRLNTMQFAIANCRCERGYVKLSDDVGLCQCLQHCVMCDSALVARNIPTLSMTDIVGGHTLGTRTDVKRGLAMLPTLAPFGMAKLDGVSRRPRFAKWEGLPVAIVATMEFIRHDKTMLEAKLAKWEPSAMTHVFVKIATKRDVILSQGIQPRHATKRCQA